MPDTLPEAPAAPVAVPTAAPATAGHTSTPTPPQPPDDQDVAKRFKARAEAAKRETDGYRGEWLRNVTTRMGRLPAAYAGGVDSLAVDTANQSELNPDWALTKTKTANLFSQVPTIRLVHENTQFERALPAFAKALNYELGEKRADVGTAMEEALNDIVNAAGVGAVMVGYMARFQTKWVPAIDLSMLPADQLPALQAVQQIPMRPVQVPASYKFYAVRVAPQDLLWPAEFTGSNFDDGDWIGRRGRLSWSEAVHEFHLSETDKDAVIGGEIKAQTLREDANATDAEAETVNFTELYYWRARVDPTETQLNCIWRLVFVDGKHEAVIHGPWMGQQRDDQTGQYVGSCRFPLRVCTLTYISDHPVPPSDTAAGRPQVNDLRQSRSQLFANRERSIPIRWFDTNRVDPLVQDQLMRGKFQGFIPSQGDGSRAIGEVARASYPAEDLAFDRQTKQDLMETWQIGPNQMGAISSGEKPTKGEVVTAQGNFATRIGQERNRVARFFLGIAEVMAGLMALYSDFPMLTPQERQQMEQAWDRRHILHDLAFTIRPDSTIVLESQDRFNRLSNFLNLTVKSGLINPLPVLVEMAELVGLDPGEVIKPPTPQGAPPPSVSLRLSGDDLRDPVVMAMLMKAGEAPDPQTLEGAKRLLAASQQSMQPPAPPPGLPGPMPPGGMTGGPPATPAVAHPDWNQASTIIKRQETGE